MERVSRLVESQPGVGKKEIRKRVEGPNDHVDEALRVLIAEGYVECRKEGQAHHHHSLHPFVDNPGSDADRAHKTRACADRAQTTVPTVPHSVPQPCPELALDRAIHEEMYGHGGAVTASVDDAEQYCRTYRDCSQTLNLTEEAGVTDATIVLTDHQLALLVDLVALRVIAALDGTAPSAPPTPEPPRLAHQRREAAAVLGVGVDTFDRHIRPMLRVVYGGDLRLWPVAELERYLDEQARRPCDGPSFNVKRPPRRANARGLAPGG